MASTPKMGYQVFLCIFQKNTALATLGLKKMEKFLWEGREKTLPSWLSQFSSALGSHCKIHWENAKNCLVLSKVGWTACLFSS